jgi:hypothetical protein
VLFLVEDEVRAHGFRLIGFRLRFQSHGFGYGISPVLNIFSWWRLVPVRHTKPPRTPAGFPRYNFRTSTGNLFLMVETDPRPPPYNAELPREFCLAYWIGFYKLLIPSSQIRKRALFYMENSPKPFPQKFS